MKQEKKQKSMPLIYWGKAQAPNPAFENTLMALLKTQAGGPL